MRTPSCLLNIQCFIDACIEQSFAVVSSQVGCARLFACSTHSASRMPASSNLLWFPARWLAHASLPVHIHARPFTCLSACSHASACPAHSCLLTCLSACSHTCLPAHMPLCLLLCMPARSHAPLPAHMPLCLLLCMPACSHAPLPAE